MRLARRGDIASHARPVVSVRLLSAAATKESFDYDYDHGGAGQRHG